MKVVADDAAALGQTVTSRQLLFQVSLYDHARAYRFYGDGVCSWNKEDDPYEPVK